MESKPEAGPAERRHRHGAKLRLPLKITTISWWDLVHTLGPILLASAVAIWLALHFVRPVPPHTLTMSGGPKGSSFQMIAERYKAFLARKGIDLEVIPSAGSVQNLERLSEPHSRFDIALVQAGITDPARTGGDTGDLVSLGSMLYQPLTIFYRARRPIFRLSQLRGQRIAIGKEGSGTRLLALTLLDANGIDPGGPTQLLDLEGEAARRALLARQVDAIFLSGDSAPLATIRATLHTRGVRMFKFAQADAYTRRFPYLHEIEIPEGAFDLGANLPARPLVLLAPAVELIAHSDLHPALCDLLIQAAEAVHGRATLLQSAHEFPNSISAYPLDDEAARYYKSGEGSLAYRYLPFSIASLVTRIAVVLVPIIVILIPGLRYLPQLYRWRVDSRIHRRYGELMALERESLEDLTPQRREALLERLEEIERAVILRKIPGSHAEQLYQLREHIGFVRRNLSRSEGAET